MNEKNHKRTVLLAEDDDDHFLLAKDGFSEADPSVELQWVRDGEELMDYLLRRGPFSSEGKAPRPRLIILDLNMPKKDGRQALREIKSHPALRTIPVVVLTTSRNDEDIHYTYSLGGSFIRKPVRFDQIVTTMRRLAEYWLDTVESPSPSES